MVFLITLAAMTILLTYYLKKTNTYFKDDDMALRILAILVSLVIITSGYIDKIIDDSSLVIIEYVIPDQTVGSLTTQGLILIFFSIILYFIFYILGVRVSKRLTETVVKPTKHRLKKVTKTSKKLKVKRKYG